MLCVSRRDCSTLYEKMSCKSKQQSAFTKGRSERKKNHVGPCDEVVGGFFHGHDHRVGHDFIRQINTRSVFDKRKAGFAATCVSPDGDVRFEIRYPSIGAIICLFGDGDEEQIHRVDEPLRTARTTCLDEAAEKPIPFRIQFFFDGGEEKKKATHDLDISPPSLLVSK